MNPGKLHGPQSLGILGREDLRTPKEFTALGYVDNQWSIPHLTFAKHCQVWVLGSGLSTEAPPVADTGARPPEADLGRQPGFLL